MNISNYLWVFEQCEITNKQIQLKLIKLAKYLNFSEWNMLLDLEALPEVISHFIQLSLLFILIK